MSIPYSDVELITPPLHPLTFPPPSKWKRCGFAIALIVGIGGLAVGAAGLAGYFHVEPFCNKAQLHTILMMAAGGGGGTVLLIIGGLSKIKNSKRATHHPQKNQTVDPKGADSLDDLGSLKPAKKIASIDTQRGLVYGKKEWEFLGVEVVEEVKTPSLTGLDTKGKILLYIPHQIQFKGEKKDLTLKTMREIQGLPPLFIDIHILNRFGDQSDPGWVLIDKDMDRNNFNKSPRELEILLNQKGASMPSLLQAVVYNLMLYALTKKRPYGSHPRTYTYCSQLFYTRNPVVVGDFSPQGLVVTQKLGKSPEVGAASVWKIPNDFRSESIAD